MKLLPSLFSCVYRRVKLFVFAMNSRRPYSIFVCIIYGLEEKNSESEVIFAVCRLPLTSCLTSRLIRYKNGRAIQKRSSNRKSLKTSALRFRVDGKQFENGTSFEKDFVTIRSCEFPDRVFLKRKCDMSADWCVFQFLRRCVDGA